jgi:hypothetical protein
MDGAGAHPGGGVAPARPGRGWLSWLLPPATALVIIVVSVLLLTTPLWMHFGLEASDATGAFSPCGPRFAYEVSDQTVNELLFGPGTFRARACDILTGPLTQPFYTYDEAAHLRDARAVLYLFVALAAAALVLIVAALLHRPKDARRWRAVARGGAGLAIGAVVVGVVGFLAFDAAFELFHRVFFPGGNWQFPADSNMIRLYPEMFWQLTAAALGVLCVLGGGVVWWLAQRRARSLGG